MHGTPEYAAYHSAKKRCNDESHPYYGYYGGRGITFEFASFDAFFKEIGKRPSDEHSLDRRDNEKGYVPGNIRWATPEEQNRNKRTNVLIEYNGVTKTLVEWCDGDENFYARAYKRISKHGWCGLCAIDKSDCCHKPDNNHAKKHTINGVTKTLTEWCNGDLTLYRRAAKRLATYKYCISCAIGETTCCVVSPEARTRKRAITKKYTLNGQEKTLQEWCNETGRRYGTVRQRIHKGWCPECAILLDKCTHR
jgi:hypothetical protein